MPDDENAADNTLPEILSDSGYARALSLRLREYMGE